MEVEENLQLIRARYDAVNAHDLDRFEKFYADSTAWSDPGLPAPISGASSVRERLEVLTTAFPDLHWNLDKNLQSREKCLC
jgi:ketosteroid isomerase-like protein